MRTSLTMIVLFPALIFAAVFVHPLFSSAADDTAVIVIERKADKNRPALKNLSSDEVLLRELIKKFSENISYEVENSLHETSETSVRRARIFVRDPSNIRVESSSGDGMEIVSVYSGNNAWIYFPKTNIIIDIPGKGKKDAGVNSQYDFIGGYIENPADYIVLKNIEDGLLNYEISGPPGNTKASYRFTAEGLPESITFVEDGLGTREIKIKNVSPGPIDEKLFKRPVNAIKMPINEIPDIER